MPLLRGPPDKRSCRLLKSARMAAPAFRDAFSSVTKYFALKTVAP